MNSEFQTGSALKRRAAFISPTTVFAELRALLHAFAIGAAVLAGTGGVSVAEPIRSIDELVLRAGNVEDDRVRVAMLETLALRADLEASVKGELGPLLAIARHWAEEDYLAPLSEQAKGENGPLAGFFFRKENLARSLFPVPEDSPLYPLHCLYRGRMLVQSVIQSTTGRSFEDWTSEGRRLLEISRKAFPDNRIVGMYLDTPLHGWPREYRRDDLAPEWANLQREGLEKLADVIHWWIEHRQRTDGSFGGGWGDDVEMWRWWLPVLVGFHDPRIVASQERLSLALFAQPHMRAGYTDIFTDVEHSAEDSTDALLPMMHLRPAEAAWDRHCRDLMQLVQEKWTGRNERGTLQFKSTYFSAGEVSEQRPHACEAPYHVRVLLPILLQWQRTRDPKITAFVREWMDTWVDATRRSERGKPAGVIPAAIQWPSGAIGGVGPQWFKPEIDRQKAYDWPSALAYTSGAMLLTHIVTGERKYLAAIEEMLAFRERHLDGPADAEPGSAAWCARQMGFLDDMLGKYRSIFPDSRFDAVLARSASGYTRFRLTGDRSRLERELKSNAEAFRSNWPGYTSECRWTDRVLRFTGYYNRTNPPAAALPLPDPRVLYSSVTGDMGYGADVLPLNAVRWLTPPREIAALVTAVSPNQFEAELFHFGESKRTMEAELLLLEPGNYLIELDSGTHGGVVTSRANITVAQRKVPIELPAHTLTRLRVTLRPPAGDAAH